MRQQWNTDLKEKTDMYLPSLYTIKEQTEGNHMETAELQITSSTNIKMYNPNYKK